MKVTLSLTTPDGAGRGLCHTNTRAAHWAASSGRPRPLGTRTEQTQVLCVQGPLSKPEAHQSAAPRSTDSVALGPQTAASAGGDTHRTARKHQGAESNKTLLQHFHPILQKDWSATNWDVQRLVLQHSHLSKYWEVGTRMSKTPAELWFRIQNKSKPRGT